MWIAWAFSLFLAELSAASYASPCTCAVFFRVCTQTQNCRVDKLPSCSPDKLPPLQSSQSECVSMVPPPPAPQPHRQFVASEEHGSGWGRGVASEKAGGWVSPRSGTNEGAATAGKMENMPCVLRSGLLFSWGRGDIGVDPSSCVRLSFSLARWRR